MRKRMKLSGWKHHYLPCHKCFGFLSLILSFFPPSYETHSAGKEEEWSSAHLFVAFSRRQTGSHLSGKKLVSVQDGAAAGRKLLKCTSVFASVCLFVHLAGIQVFCLR